MAQIKTYARLKPTKKAYNGYMISKNVLTMHIPDNKDFVILGPQNNLRSNFSYDILFTNIFGCEASQEEVFDGVAKDIIQNFLNGYNGTIFAYGQTGTGKTYTVEGNTNRYSARGLATRALSMIYQELEKRSDQHISVYLSYLEIYQEVAYDLLNPAARSTIPIAPFARVTVVEGPRGSCILRGLSLHLAANEEIAQMLLLQGQANRKVAETPVNQRSSRSHAVFTVYLQVRKHDSDVLVNSKLHLVDLAGSERVSKTGVDGQQLTEAKSINLSLHHLETVIIALQLDKATSAVGRGDNPPQQSKSNSSLMSSGPSSDNGGSRQLRFVPYRNSLLTMVLKDSLGGNCLTAMIATISLEPENLGESISTCRFAQRVACIANNARRNEEVDDKAMIKRLKNKVAYLENQVALLGSKGRSDPMTDEEIMDVLTDEDQRICERIMEGFLQGIITDPIEAGISDHCRFRACLHLLKQQFIHRSLGSPSLAAGVSTSSAVTGIPGSSGAATTHGTSTSTSTLQPRASSSCVDMLGANNPQQDSGDYAAVGQTRSQGRSTAKDGLKRSDEFADSRERQGNDSYSSRLQTESSPTTKAARVGGDEMTPSYSSELNGTSHSKNGSNKVNVKKGGLEEVLQACSSGGRAGGGGVSFPANLRYKSPFERQREKEIQRLSRKLTEMEEDKAGKESHLQEMKEQAIVEELLVAETGLRLKLQVAEEQVADQHAYLLQLKHLQADPDLITKEQLVEKQLRKRQAKFHEKLSKVLSSKETLEQDFAQRRSGQGVSTAANGATQQYQADSGKMSLEERFGQYKQGKGALNTRQVFDLLKNEEKKRQKESQKVERETTMVKTKQLAIKEAATLEKLRELKQMLKLSLLKEEQQIKQKKEELTANDPDIMGRSGESSSFALNSSSNKARGQGHERASSLHYSNYGHGPFHHDSHSDKLKSQSMAAKPNGDLYSAGRSHVGGSSRNQAWTGRSPGNQNQSQHCSNMTVDQNVKVQQFMAEVLSGKHLQHEQQQQQQPIPVFSVSHTSSSTLTPGNGSRGHSATPENFNLDEVFMSEPHAEVSGRLSPPAAAASKSFHEPRHSFKFLQERSREDFLSDAAAKDSETIGREKPERFAYIKGKGEAAVTKLNMNANNAGSIGFDSNGGDDELLVSDLETSPALHDWSSKRLDRQTNKTTLDQSKNYLLSENGTGDEGTGMLSQPNLGVAQEAQSPLPSLLALQQLQQDQNLGPLVPPSEYINSMSSEDQFDARRMGLSSRTFESALCHMLDGDVKASAGIQNAPNLPYSVDPYEGFTRSPRSQPRAGRQNFSLSESPYRQRRTQHASKSPTRNQTKLSGGKNGQEDFGYRSVPASAWGPESKNASVADRLTNFLESKSLQKDELAADVVSEKIGRSTSNRKTEDLDPFETKLAMYKNEAFNNQNTSYNNGNDSDEAVTKYKKECEDEDDSFFGLQPAKTRLTALSEEEGEKKFMSTVAAEKARVEKIRRARNAAEIIQRQWRRFRPRQ